MRLSDGRMLAFCEYGDRTGKPVIFVHGWPGSRCGARLLDVEASKAGVRLIAPDRPGIGLSDPKPGRTLLDWSADVKELAHHLGVERISLIGVSAGMPYVLACCYAIPGSIHKAAILSGMGRLDAPGALEQMYAQARVVYSLGQRSSRFAALWVAMFARMVRNAPGVVLEQQERGFCDADRAVFARAEVRQARLDDLQEGCRQGAAAAQLEVALHLADWGFPLGEITTEIFLWHGMLDKSHPLTMATRCVDVLPHCRPIFVAGAGSLGYIDRLKVIFEELFAETLPDR